MKVMVIDDEPVMVRGIVKHIKWEDYGFEEPVGMTRAREALARLETEPFDLVITDIKMPEITGLELIKNMRERMHQAAIIIISGYSDFEYAQEAIHLGGVRAYLLKPVKTEEIEAILRKMYEEKGNELREVFGVVTDQEKGTQALEHPTIRAAVRYVMENYEKDLSVKSIAGECQVNTDYLSFLFKKQTGVNLNSFVNAVRVVKARNLLMQEDAMRVNEVAYKVGYSSSRYFAEQFRLILGCSPSEVRKRKSK